jgi:hypothetical protein
MGWTTEWSEFISRYGREFSPPRRVGQPGLDLRKDQKMPPPNSTAARPTLGPTQLPIQWVKRSGRDGDHPHPSSAEVKKTWLYTATSPYAFRDSFYTHTHVPPRSFTGILPAAWPFFHVKSGFCTSYIVNKSGREHLQNSLKSLYISSLSSFVNSH